MNPLLIHTPGEPAGIGPELLVKLIQQPIAGCRLAIADARVLERAARQLKLNLQLMPWNGKSVDNCAAAELYLLDEPLAQLPEFGEPTYANARSLLNSLDRAVDLASKQSHCAIVTGPLNKAVINDAGISFSGHTEYLAQASGGKQPVMMLVAGELRVALATTHLPLREVADAINQTSLQYTMTCVDKELKQHFGISKPRIAVCGLNPHAGENGHMGREEIDVIEPAIEHCRRNLNVELSGPWPADTLFTPDKLAQCDAILAMYHDQGLPTLKHAGFGQAVNVTLGLPIIRCSVDHGTALDLAGTGTADVGSLRAAESLAMSMAAQHG